MGLMDFLFEKVEVKEDQPANPTPVQGGAGKTSFSRRLPSLTPEAETPVSPATSADMSFLPSVTKKPADGIDASKLHAHFDDVLSKSGSAAPNYFTFSQMLAEMGDELPDGAKYKGAFGALRAQGLSKQALVNSANTFLTLLDQDNAGFKKEAMDAQKESQDQITQVNNLVALNNQNIDKVKNDVAAQIKQLEDARDMKIRQLQKEIDDNKKKVAPLEEAAAKINDRIKAFDSACQDYKGMISTDIQKIQTIIKE